MASIIIQYADEHSLKIALPEPDPYHVGWPKPYRPVYVKNYKSSPHNILTHHIVYDRCYVQHDFPRSRTIYLTILREPWTQFISTVNYFRFPEFPPTEKPLRDILEEPEKWAKPIPMREEPDYNATRSLVRNMMANDLGFHNELAGNHTAIELFIERLDRDFDLVMILEYFYESLVLMRRLLCWELSDIFHLKLNEKRYHAADPELPFVTTEMKAKHRELDHVDYVIYGHFKSKFLKIMREQDDSFRREVDLFKDGLHDVKQFCKNVKASSNETYTMKKNEFMSDFQITAQKCEAWKVLP